MVVRLILLVASVVLVWASNAQAQPSAAELYAEGVALRDAGDMAGACRQFITSARLEQVPAVVAAAAACREREGDLTEAVRMYSVAAAIEPDPAVASQWRAEAQRVRTTASVLTLRFHRLPETAWFAISVDGVPVEWRGHRQRTLLLPAGTHTVTVDRPACGTWSEQVVTTPAAGVGIDVRVLACADDDSDKYDKQNVLSYEERQKKKETGVKVRRRYKRLYEHDASTYLVLGGVGLTIATGALWYQSTRLDDKARRLPCVSGGDCHDEERRALEDESDSYVKAAKLSFIAAVGTVTLGWILHDPDGDKKKAKDVAIVPTEGGAMVGFGGSF